MSCRGLAATPLTSIARADGDDNPYRAYTVTLNPGEAKIPMNFVTGLGTKGAAATTQAVALTALPYTGLECLASAEKLPISNFAIPTPTAIQATKAFSGNTYVGGTGTYTVVLTHTGGTLQQDNPADECTDLLPATLQFVRVTASSGATAGNAGTNTATWNGTLANSGSVTITICGTILSSAAGPNVSNQGTISYDSDGDGSNDASTVTSFRGGIGPTVFAVAASLAFAIPLFLRLSLAWLALVFAGLALFAWRRRIRTTNSPLSDEQNRAPTRWDWRPVFLQTLSTFANAAKAICRLISAALSGLEHCREWQSASANVVVS